MSTAPLQATAPGLLLVVISGPDKGVSYRLVSQKITIGRDAENDIVLNDQRCSRHHIELTISQNQIIAKDVGSKSGIFISGKQLQETYLQINETFRIGDSVLSLRWAAETSQSQLQTQVATGVMPSVGSMTVVGGAASTPIFRRSPNKKKNKLLFYATVAFVGFVLYVLVSRNPNNNPGNYGIRTEQQIQEDIESIQKKKDEIFRDKMAQGVFNNQASEAQAAYIQGFRDFREGNFGRAIQSFTAALALNPEHQLAIKYKRLAEKKLDELVQYHMLEGKRYYDQNKFELARSAYRNVLILLNDQNNKTYQEARERLQEVDLLLKGRY